MGNGADIKRGARLLLLTSLANKWKNIKNKSTLQLSLIHAHVRPPMGGVTDHLFVAGLYLMNDFTQKYQRQAA